MRISNLCDNRDGGTRTVSMDLDWEEAEHSLDRLYFEADGETADLFHPSPDPFVIACLPLAGWLGERRLIVEGAICTRLEKGLKALNEVYSRWFPNVQRVSMEPSEGFVARSPPPERHLASMLSGGVDGLASLRRNRLDYPLGHPNSIRACITLFGIGTYDVTEEGPSDDRLRTFESLLERLGKLAGEEHFDLLPVRTNVRRIAPDYRAWTKVGFGAGHIAAAQLFQGSFDRVLFSSDGDGPDPPPGAMHPLTNFGYSTGALTVQSDQDEMRRSEKVALLADWEAGRRWMQPCHHIEIPGEGKINCGSCEKCVRTMLVLIGLGRLDEVDAFRGMDVSPEKIRRIPIHNRRKLNHLLDSLPLLEEAGRDDLVKAIRRRARKYRFRRK